MEEHTKKPGYMLLLETRGIAAGGYFCLGAPQGKNCFRVTGDCRLLDLDGAPAALDENRLWERWDSLTPITRREFIAARDALREARRAADGRPTDAELEPLARQFAQEYAAAYAAGRWKEFCAWDEETLRRILLRAAALLPGVKGARAVRKKAAQLFSEVIAAGLKSGLAGPRRKKGRQGQGTPPGG